ncbi:hypothetical protein B5X24_HaOG201834 [Helicoverpa armigera]|nr:hypothetical protein B5X24_HaOG201834 [Helicoverpa armigera]
MHTTTSAYDSKVRRERSAVSGRQAFALLRSHYTAPPSTHFTASQRILAPHINAHFHSSATHPRRHIIIAQLWWKHPHIFTAQLDILARHISIAHLWWKRSLNKLVLGFTKLLNSSN